MSCKFCEDVPVVVPTGVGAVGEIMLGRLDEYSDTIHLVVLDRDGLATSLGKCEYCPKCGKKLIPESKKYRPPDLTSRVGELEWKVDAIAKTQQALWEDYVERGTKRKIAPLEKSLGCKIWEGFKK